MSPPGEQRRKHDNLPPEVREYIDAAAKSGAKEAFLMLAFEISRTGIKKVLYAIGAAVVGLVSAVTYFITHGSGGPK